MFLSTTHLEKLLSSTSSGHKDPQDELFVEADNLLPKFKKLGVITDLQEVVDEIVVNCNVPGCNETFENIASYQTHYNSVHRYLCAICKRAFLPTPHLLDLHISENHDSYFQAKVDRGDPMFACYLEECSFLASTPLERRRHMIDSHKFPSNFRFYRIGAMKKNKHRPTTDVETESSSLGAGSNTRIQSFSFGQSTERSFNKACTKSRGATLDSMSDLMEALEED